MNDLRSPPTYGGPNRRPEDLDGLLRRFFRSEMPEPWPEAPPVPRARLRPAAAPQKKRVGRPWFRISGRFAVAASVALLVIGYLALAERFPTGGTPGNVGKDLTHPMGRNQGHQTLPPKTPIRITPEKSQGNPALKLIQPEPTIRGMTTWPTTKGRALEFQVVGPSRK
jgi:hypothetical protein